MAEPVPFSLLLVCSGRQCLPLLTLPTAVVSEAEARGLMRRLAAHLRAQGGMGRVVLVGPRGTKLATQGIWP